MKRAALMGFVVLAACVAQPQTTRDLERISHDYQRRQAEEQASRAPTQRPANDTCGLTEHAALIGVPESELRPPANARVICYGCAATNGFQRHAPYH